MYVNGLHQYSFNMKGVLRVTIPMTTQWKDFSSVVLSVQSFKSFYAEYLFNQSAIILNPHQRMRFEWFLMCSKGGCSHSGNEAMRCSLLDSYSSRFTVVVSDQPPKRDDNLDKKYQDILHLLRQSEKGDHASESETLPQNTVSPASSSGSVSPPASDGSDHVPPDSDVMSSGESKRGVEAE